MPDFLGALPDSAASEIKPFFLSYESLGQHAYFQLAGNSEDDLRDLYAEPYFFQAVHVDAGATAMSAASRTSGVTGPDAGPRWLLWSPLESGEPPGFPENDQTPNETWTNDVRPKVLARFTSEAGPPFLVERQIGRGRVLFAASGLLSNWNTLPKTNAIVMFDRILRSLMQTTLPVRNYGSVERIAVPVPSDTRENRLVLFRPGRGAISEPLETGFLGTSQSAVTVERPLARGIYRVQALGSPGDATAEQRSPASWELEFAVNGDESESDLEPVDRELFGKQNLSEALRWLDANEEISLAGARVRGQDMWWWLALAVFVLLLGEFAVILVPGSSLQAPDSRLQASNL
jgi:hypothetical protein